MKNDLNYWVNELSSELAKNSGSEIERLNISHLIYLLEVEITKLKDEKGLKSYNPKIHSRQIAESFLKNQLGLFEVIPIIPKALTKHDYSYYLLVFLLVQFCEYKGVELSLHEIIDDFVDLHKENSLTYVDIQLTATGVTRCKTNLRFAFDGLKDLGLVKLYNREDKEKSWMLTYMGFIVATSIIFFPDEKRPVHIDEGIRLCHSIGRGSYDRWLIRRIINLGNRDFFYRVLHEIYPDSLTNEELRKGLFIFEELKSFFEDIESKHETARAQSMAVKHFLAELEKYQLLDNFMQELSRKFNSDMFLEKIRRILGYSYLF
jgi:hypothetical protein